MIPMTTTQQDAQVGELIALLRREGTYSGVWFREHLLEAADTIAALSTASVPPQAVDTGEEERIDAILNRQGWHGEPSIGQAAVRVLMSLHADAEVARLRELCRANNDLARMNAKDRDEWRAKAARAMDALEAIAEGNLGDAPWQANYDRIREVARAALEPQAKDV